MSDPTHESYEARIVRLETILPRVEEAAAAVDQRLDNFGTYFDRELGPEVKAVLQHVQQISEGQKELTRTVADIAIQQAVHSEKITNLSDVVAKLENARIEALQAQANRPRLLDSKVVGAVVGALAGPVGKVVAVATVGVLTFLGIDSPWIKAVMAKMNGGN